MRELVKSVKRAEEIVKELGRYRFRIKNEKRLQNEIYKVLEKFNVKKEYRLDEKSIVDFYVEGVAIELKIKSGTSADSVLSQCERYCEFPKVEVIVLVTSRFHGFPKIIKNKPCYFVHLSKGLM